MKISVGKQTACVCVLLGGQALHSSVPGGCSPSARLQPPCTDPYSVAGMEVLALLISSSKWYMGTNGAACSCTVQPQSWGVWSCGLQVFQLVVGWESHPSLHCCLGFSRHL